MRKAFPLATAMALLAGTAACSDPPPVRVDGGQLRLNPNPQAPSAAYFTIHAGADPLVLRSVLTEQAVRLEMHESVTQDGVATMRRVESIAVPAREKVVLQPGGKHIMLWSINPQALAAGRMTFTFIFSNGDRIIADAIVQRPGAGAAQSGNDGEHDSH
jgi:copper(I)-binding protein